MNDVLDLTRGNVELLTNFNSLLYTNMCNNLFVITHLGQLKQMEVLIKKEGITENYLLVLFTSKNIMIPQSVHDSFNADLFLKVLFLEIPFGANRFEYKKLKNIESKYQTIVQSISPKCLYLNSFEGHYAMLISIAKEANSLVCLVEEGTATYKMNLESYVDSNNEKLNYLFIKDNFMQTVGKTQLFKKIVRMRKNSKEFAGQSKKFIKMLWYSRPLQKEILKILGDDRLMKSLVPATKFDKIYSAFPNLLKDSFQGEKKYFFLYDDFDRQELAMADGIIKKYNIKASDAIYLSQRYFSDSELYASMVCNILNKVVDSDKRIFIKLHPKEKEFVADVFRGCIEEYEDRFIIIDDFNFLIEPVIANSKISTIIGLTSTTLVYANLLSKNIQAISIARMLIDELNEKDCTETEALKLLNSHLSILQIFEKVLII